jgi:hypothetical protein
VIKSLIDSIDVPYFHNPEACILLNLMLLSTIEVVISVVGTVDHVSYMHYY